MSKKFKSVQQSTVLRARARIGAEGDGDVTDAGTDGLEVAASHGSCRSQQVLTARSATTSPFTVTSRASRMQRAWDAGQEGNQHSHYGQQQAGLAKKADQR